MKIKLAKDQMEREEGLNHLLVEVTPQEKEEKVEKPIAFVLVLDVSASMNGGATGKAHSSFTSLQILPYSSKPNARRFSPQETHQTKLDFVKQASERMVDMLKDGDYLGVVSFSNIAQLEYPLSPLNQQTRFQMKDRIRQLRTMGATNVSDGLELAYEQIPEQLKETHHIKMILLSDGEANYGIRDADGMATIARTFEDKGVAVSTIGVGVQYNSYFMETIATASGGMFYHLSEMTLLQDIFRSEIEKLHTLTMKNLRITVQVEEGMHLEDNLNGYDKQGERYFVGHVYNPLKVVFQLATIENVQKESLTVQVTLHYENEHDEKCQVQKEVVIPLVEEEDIAVNAEVTEYVKQLMEAKVQKEALRHYENRDDVSFTKSIDGGLMQLQKMSASYQMDVTEGMATLDSFQTNMKERKLDDTQLKNMYRASYSVMRNEEDK